jgi:hypothetical protein
MHKTFYYAEKCYVYEIKQHEEINERTYYHEKGGVISSGISTPIY